MQYKLRFLNDEAHKKLKELAKEDSRSLNYLINKAIEQFIEKQSAKA